MSAPRLPGWTGRYTLLEPWRFLIDAAYEGASLANDAANWFEKWLRTHFDISAPAPSEGKQDG